VTYFVAFHAKITTETRTTEAYVVILAVRDYNEQFVDVTIGLADGIEPIPDFESNGGN